MSNSLNINNTFIERKEFDTTQLSADLQDILQAYKCNSKVCFWILALLWIRFIAPSPTSGTDTTTSNIKVLINYFNMINNRPQIFTQNM